jgi:hypothetical protein
LSAHHQICDQSNVCKQKEYFLDFERPTYNIKLEMRGFSLIIVAIILQMKADDTPESEKDSQK